VIQERPSETELGNDHKDASIAVAELDVAEAGVRERDRIVEGLGEQRLEILSGSNQGAASNVRAGTYPTGNATHLVCTT
jgi:hypothetical protein